jgi:RNA polymerase sigma-70 factor (ECF subfamily)
MKDAREETVFDSAVVFGEHRERIHRHILRMVRDPTEAEDLTQETFMRAHRSLSSLQDAASLTSWLYRIATHVCYDRFRQSSYRDAPESLERVSGDGSGNLAAKVADSDAPKLDEIVERKEMSACVQKYLEELPDDYRAAIMLHDLHGLSNPEIAQMLGCSLDTVKIRVHRARRKLEAALAAGCDFAHDERGVYVCERKGESLPGLVQETRAGEEKR